MKKFNKKIITTTILIFMIVLTISPTILLAELGDLDEIWNYNFGNCVSNSLVPYKDFSMLQTPLLSFISGTILSITSNSLLTMRILAIILSTAILFLVFKILEKLKVNKLINLLSIILLTFLYLQFFRIDYNFFSAFWVLLILYFELTLNQDKKSSNIIIGLCAGLAFLTKQTVGAFVCIGIVLYKTIFEIYIAKKNKEKFKFKNILFRILGGAIPILIFGIYLLVNGALGDFIDYTILSISTFSNVIKYDTLLRSQDICISSLSIFIPISFVIMFFYSTIKKNKKLFMIFVMSIVMFIIAFPISDDIHFMIGIIPSFVGIIYLFDKLVRKICGKTSDFLVFFAKPFSILLVLLFIVMSTNAMIKDYSKERYYSNLKHFELIPISEDFEQEILSIDDYIQKSSKKVYILNFDAAIYMIPIGRYNKNYDMLMNGNLGGKGASGLVEDIKNEKNAIYLVLNDDFYKNWQHPYEVTDYVEKNLIHNGSIGNFEIYETKN